LEVEGRRGRRQPFGGDSQPGDGHRGEARTVAPSFIAVLDAVPRSAGADLKILDQAPFCLGGDTERMPAGRGEGFLGDPQQRGLAHAAGSEQKGCACRTVEVALGHLRQLRQHVAAVAEHRGTAPKRGESGLPFAMGSPLAASGRAASV